MRLYRGQSNGLFGSYKCHPVWSIMPAWFCESGSPFVATVKWKLKRKLLNRLTRERASLSFSLGWFVCVRPFVRLWQRLDRPSYHQLFCLDAPSGSGLGGCCPTFCRSSSDLITPSLLEMRSALKGNWRHYLKKKVYLCAFHNTSILSGFQF